MCWKYNQIIISEEASNEANNYLLQIFSQQTNNKTK